MPLSIYDAHEGELFWLFICPAVINLSHIKETKPIYIKGKEADGNWSELLKQKQN